MMHEGRTIRGEIGIEDLLQWAFINEKATIYDESGLDATAHYPEDCIVRCERVDTLGGFITATSPGARICARDTCHDAEVVAEAVMDLHPGVRQLVYTHGKAGNRPDWRPDAVHRWVPVEDSDGIEWEPYPRVETVPEFMRVDHRGRPNWRQRREFCPVAGRLKRVPPPTWCPVREVDAPATIATYRARYLDWATALHDLRAMLCDGLERWTLTHAVPPLRPWLSV